MRLMVDTLFPRDRLLLAMERFAADSPHVAIDLYETVRLTVGDGGTEDCDLAIQIAMPGTDHGAIVARVDPVAVARSDHSLARESHAISAARLAGHQRFAIHGFDRIGIHHDSEGRVWHVNTVEAAVDVVRRGLCFGWLALHLIKQDLAMGSLVRLALQVPEVRTYALAITSPGAIHKTDPVLARLTALLM